MKRTIWIKAAAAIAVACIVGVVGCVQPTQMAGGAVPQYKVDPLWPKPLKGNLIWGQVSSVAVDSRDHVWVLHRPNTMLDDDKGAQLKPPANRCCTPAPAVVEFDPDGKKLGSFGRPGRMAGEFRSVHNIAIDSNGNIYTAEVGYGRRLQKFKLQ